MWFSRQSLEVVEQIGEGLNARVYKACYFHPHFKKNYFFALKALKRSEDFEHSKKESENLLQVSGEHLVAFRGWYYYKKSPALILDYIDGLSLYELFQQRLFSEGEVSYIEKEVRAGLAELQSSNLFHGDLSLKNIMISTKGEVKLIDFAMTLWRSQCIEASPEFMSPEILAGSSPTHKTDLYSLQKVIMKISARLDEKSVDQAPKESLAQKVIAIKKPSQTARLDLKRPQTIKTKIDFKTWALSPLFLLFFFPLSLPNSISEKITLKVRSPFWLALKSAEKERWCYTPCEIQLKSYRSQKIYWRSKTNQGVFTFAPNKKKQLIIISKNDLKK